MSRLINEDELVHILQVMQSTETMSYGRKIYGKVMQQVKDLPTIDAEPIRHGHWIDINGDGTLWRCSVCGEMQCCDSNYCGECGAKMEGVTE